MWLRNPFKNWIFYLFSVWKRFQDCSGNTARIRQRTLGRRVLINLKKEGNSTLTWWSFPIGTKEMELKSFHISFGLMGWILWSWPIGSTLRRRGMRWTRKILTSLQECLKVWKRICNNRRISKYKSINRQRKWRLTLARRSQSSSLLTVNSL